MSRTPRCLTTATSQVASRRTSSIVFEKGADDPSRVPAGALPPQPNTMRSASSSAAASTMPSAAWRPMRTIGWIGVPCGTKSRTRCSRRRAWRARVAPSERAIPSGTSTMPSAVSSPPRGSRRSAPRRTSSSAVAGLATGMTTRIGSGSLMTWDSRYAGARVARAVRPAGPSVPALEEVGLQALELTGLALDALLRPLRRQVTILDDEARDAPEVDRHEGRDEGVEPVLGIAGGDDEVVDDARAQRVGREPAAHGIGDRARLGGELDDGVGGRGGEHRPPRVGHRQRAGMEL